MRRRFVFLGLVSLAAGAAMWWYAGRSFDRLVVTTRVVVPAKPVPAYTLITPDLLTTKEVPRSLLAEPIYTDPSEVVGRLSTVPLVPGVLLYRAFVVSPADFRLSADPALEVIAFPVSVAAAVGGEVRAGQRINLYRAVVDPNALASRATGGIPELDSLLAARYAAVERLAEGVGVAAVQSAQGQRVSATSGNSRDASGQSLPPVQIITVAVEPSLAMRIVQLVAEGRAQVELWVSLAPLVTAEAAE